MQHKSDAPPPVIVKERVQLVYVPMYVNIFRAHAEWKAMRRMYTSTKTVEVVKWKTRYKYIKRR